MNKYKLEWENGLTRIIKSKFKLHELKLKGHWQEGLRSITQIND